MASPQEPSTAPLPVARAESYEYEHLLNSSSFRVAELLPGTGDEPITCHLHVADWDDIPQYEAISYAWGDPTTRAPVVCDGKTIQVTKSLHTALSHFRQPDRSRSMWADALCIDQRNISERSFQVEQMKRIYGNAQSVQVWLGPDHEEHLAETAIQSIQTISDFLCEKLGVDILEHRLGDETYQELLLRSKDKLPLPNATEFSSEGLWKSLVWLYTHRYFTRAWVIQEISANMNREVNVGYCRTGWNRVDLVASYIIIEPAVSDELGFSGAYCWWVATIAELIIRPERWLNMLYLASNYGCLDARDVIYSLRGQMRFADGGSLLTPDYTKSIEEVYRDSVEAALINFKKTDVLLYIAGNENPSWIPRWDVPMLFRNPFRFGKPMPWRPAGDTKAAWFIDKSTNVLTLSGSVIENIETAESYNQLWFANGTIDSEGGRAKLRESWARILRTFGHSHQSLPLTQPFLASVAMSLSFGLNHRFNPFEQLETLRYFVAYLQIVLADDPQTLSQYIPSDLLRDAEGFDGRAFGKPVWDFQYPESSIFVTKNMLVGCAIATTQAGDAVFIASGSTYPMILRPDGANGDQTKYAIRGFAYVDGVMNGERASDEVLELQIR